MKTKEYDKFKFIKWNRKIDRKHVAKLKRAITENNMLADFPILVDDDMNIIDGQHRLTAVKELRIEIHYKVAKTVNAEMVDKLNSVSKKWSQWDYLNKHLQNGNENYSKLKKFMGFSQLPSPTLNAVLLMSRDGIQRMTEILKSGDFVYPKVTAHAYRVVNMLHMLREYGFGYWNQRNLAYAFIKLFNLEDFDEKKFLKKLEYLSLRFRRCVSVDEYISMIEKIYNYKERKNTVLSRSL